MISGFAWAGIGLVGGGTIAALLTPSRVRYSESIDIAASADEIYDHIRYQQRLMLWSAWPSETGSSCASEGPDGEVGARTVFFDKNGKRFGYQEVVELQPKRSVTLRLFGAGPPQTPILTFELEPLGPALTRVHLKFDNAIRRPFNVAMHLMGIVRWTRAMHRKDLNGLKRFAEPPHLTYSGEPADHQLAA